MNVQRLAERLVDWLRNEVQEAAHDGLVFGLSGGLDSSVVAVLARRAFRERHLGLILPVRSDARDREDARLVVDKFEIRSRELDLDPTFEAFIRTLEAGSENDGSPSVVVARANVKARLRMIALYYFANRHQFLVVGAGNRSELSIGYFTKYGDGGVDLLPLGLLVKEEVAELASHLGIPQSIVDKPLMPGLVRGQTDEGELGFSYQELDDYLHGIGASDEVAAKIDHLRRTNAHKLRTPRMPPSFRDVG